MGTKDDYVLAKAIGWEDYFPTYKQFTSFLETTPEIRWYKPTPNQRAIHAADWRKFWSEHPEQQSELLDARPEVLDAIARAQRSRKLKNQRKGRR